MQQHEYLAGLDALARIEMHELEAHGVIDSGDTGAWVDFTRDRIRWATHANPLRAERLWNLINGELPATGDIPEESADALHEILQLAQEFGWRADSGLWRWLRARLESYQRHDARVVELLEANNDYLQQARDARAEKKAVESDLAMYVGAWQRELGTLFNKRHFIDALVKTTRHVVERAAHADRIDAIAASRRRGVYVASKVRHAPTWKTIRSAGLPIISTWIDEAGQGESKDLADLWRRCIAEASSAQVLILYCLPDETLKGAWVELGAALAVGVPVYAVGIAQFTVANDRRITHFDNLDAAIDAARKLVAVAA